MDIFVMVVKRPWLFLIDLSRKFLSPSTEKRKVLMEKENKKATASEKLTKVVAIRISQTDYDIFLEKAKMENPESTKINISKYLCSVLHDSTISNFNFLKNGVLGVSLNKQFFKFYGFEKLAVCVEMSDTPQCLLLDIRGYFPSKV